MKYQFLEQYIKDMKTFCLDLNNKDLLKHLYTVVMIAELAQQIMKAAGYSKKEYEYRAITKVLHKENYKSNLDDLEVILAIRTDIIHLKEYVRAVNTTVIFTEEIYANVFNTLIDMYRFITKKHRGRLKSELEIGDDFITKLLKLTDEVEVAATVDNSEEYNLLYQYAKQTAPQSIIESDEYGGTEEERVLNFVRGQLSL